MTPEPNEPMICLHKVTKRYGALTVIDDLDLAIARGEKVTLIGPSGSGRTTVLRRLMMLKWIDSGAIWVDGKLLTHIQRKMLAADRQELRRARGKIGTVFRHLNPFPHMTRSRAAWRCRPLSSASPNARPRKEPPTSFP